MKRSWKQEVSCPWELVVDCVQNRKISDEKWKIAILSGTTKWKQVLSVVSCLSLPELAVDSDGWNTLAISLEKSLQAICNAH